MSRSHRRRIGAMTVAATAATIALTLTTAGAGSADPVATTTSAAAAAASVSANSLRATALALAAGNGDAAPSAMRYVVTTHAAAIAASAPGENASQNSDDPVYLVVAQGSFVGRLAKVPPSAPLPTGNVLTLVLDAQTGQITDWGISDASPDLAALGTAEDLG